MHSDIYKPFLFKLAVMIGGTELYISILVCMTLNLS